MVGFGFFYRLLIVVLVILMNFVLFVFIGRIGSFDGPNHLFDSFSTVLRKALSPLFFTFFYNSLFSTLYIE